MKYTEEEMILHSDSGYCMPFEAPQGEDVELSLGYGEQTHPETGEQFFHHGIDFPVRYRMLAAGADGIVSGVGSDPVHGICQTIRYGEYEVTYGHLSNVYAQFGQREKAGQTVALSGERLHVGVRFKGEELNPIEFLTMLYGNIRALQEAGGEAAGGFCEPAPATDYEQYRREIEVRMLRFLPCYMEDLRRRTYTVPAHTEQSLRHIFTTGAMKEYFYERMPSMYNPLGLGRKALPLVGKVQNLLIADFLNYLALRHEVYLPAMGGDVKKKTSCRSPDPRRSNRPAGGAGDRHPELRHTEDRHRLSRPRGGALVDKSVVQQPGRGRDFGGDRTGAGHTVHPRQGGEGCLARRVFPETDGGVPSRYRTDERATAQTDKHIETLWTASDTENGSRR